jgi:hypothetical protein
MPLTIMGARAAGRRPLGRRVALGVGCALLLTGCASAPIYLRQFGVTHGAAASGEI